MNTAREKEDSVQEITLVALRNHDRRFSYFRFLQVLSVCICVHLWFLPSCLHAQEDAAQEVAVNLAEGRVVVCAAQDGIVVATIDVHTEPGSRQPEVVALSALRAGILLGAVEWVQPESKDKPVRLDNELPHIVGGALNVPGQPNNSFASNDIEAIGVALLERVREVAGLLHHKIKLGEDEPLIRFVLVDYVPGYGPEAWTIDYRIRQDELGNDYWRTRVLRPTYSQLYPPEKGQPHTLIEARYPPANRAKDAPELLDLLRQNDPRLAGMRAANEILAKSVTFVVEGQSQKSLASSDADFLRAAIPAVTPPETKFTMALIDFDRGFRWLIEPPKDERPPVDATPREPEAPSLRRKPTN